jgi:hypothetical protein
LARRARTTAQSVFAELLCAGVEERPQRHGAIEDEDVGDRTGLVEADQRVIAFSHDGDFQRGAHEWEERLVASSGGEAHQRPDEVRERRDLFLGDVGSVEDPCER